MADDDSGLPNWAKGWVGKATGGIIGKVATLGAAAFGAGAVVAFSLSKEPWVALAGIVVVCGSFLYCLHRMLKYAETNPEPASMEGKEFLELRKKQIEIAGSNQPAVLPPPEANTAPPAALVSPEAAKDEKNA